MYRQDLLEHGADVDATKNDGWTALHLAILGEHIEVVKVHPTFLRCRSHLDICCRFSSPEEPISINSQILGALLFIPQPVLDSWILLR